MLVRGGTIIVVRLRCCPYTCYVIRIVCREAGGLESSAVFRFFVVFDNCSRVCLFSEVQLEYIRELIRSTFLCGEGMRDFFVLCCGG